MVLAGKKPHNCEDEDQDDTAKYEGQEIAFARVSPPIHIACLAHDENTSISKLFPSCKRNSFGSNGEQANSANLPRFRCTPISFRHQIYELMVKLDSGSMPLSPHRMGKKRKVARKASHEDQKVEEQTRYNIDEAFADSEDEFYAGRDQILLDNGPTNKRRRRLEAEGVGEFKRSLLDLVLTGPM